MSKPKEDSTPRPTSRTVLASVVAAGAALYYGLGKQALLVLRIFVGLSVVAIVIGVVRYQGRTLWYSLALLASGVCLLWLFIHVFEGSFIYFPVQYPEGYWKWEKKAPIPITSVFLTTDDDIRIHGWLFEPEQVTSTILFFHGNAGNLSHRAHWCYALSRLDTRVFIIDYRGYGKSEGHPDEDGLYSDARAAYSYLVDELQIAPSTIFLYGKSLGGAPAAELALTLPAAGLILQSTFSSMPDMARHLFPLAPVHWLTRTHFATKEKLPRISLPVCIIHSRNDELIPFEMAVTNHGAAREPKELHLFDGPDHNGLIPQQGEALSTIFETFIEKHLPQPSDE